MESREPRAVLERGTLEKGIGLVFVISAPSGTGKTTLVRKVMENVPGLRFSVSYTTRAPRANEEEGVDYHFVSPPVFKAMRERGEFLEWAEVLGNCYGTALFDLERLKSEGVDLLLDLDTQGASKVAEKIPQAVLIFILPPSPEALRERLVGRAFDSKEGIEFRLSNAHQELKEAYRYHYLVLNERVADATKQLEAIILAERCRALKPWILKAELKKWEEVYGKNYR